MTLTELERKYLAGLHEMSAACNLLSQLESNKSKGKMLMEIFESHPYTKRLFRYGYDTTAKLPAAIKWAIGTPRGYKLADRVEAMGIARSINGRNLELLTGLSPHVVSLAFERAGFDPIEEKNRPKRDPLPQVRSSPFMIEVNSVGDGVVNAGLVWNNIRIGVLQLDIDKQVEKAFKHLESLGVVVSVPTYIKFPKPRFK